MFLGLLYLGFTFVLFCLLYLLVFFSIYMFLIYLFVLFLLIIIWRPSFLKKEKIFLFVSKNILWVVGLETWELWKNNVTFLFLILWMKLLINFKKVYYKYIFIYIKYFNIKIYKKIKNIFYFHILSYSYSHFLKITISSCLYHVVPILRVCVHAS